MSELEEARIYEVEIPMAGTAGDGNSIALKHDAGACEAHVAVKRVSEASNRDEGVAPHAGEYDPNHVANNAHADRGYGA